jgi:magnesium transporter
MRAFVLDGEKVVETSDFDVVRRAHEQEKHYWIDLGDESEEGAKFLRDVIRAHPLVIEDVWADRQLPKVEDFDAYLYILVHGTRRGSNATGIEMLELDILLGSHWVVTHQKESRSVAAVTEELRRSPRLLAKGSAWVVHALLDHLVDHYLPLLDEMDDELDKLEVDVLTKAGTPNDRGLMKRMLSLKRAIQRLRRVSIHQRDILLRLSRREFDEIPADATPFYRDVYDHFARVTELSDSHRDMAAAVMEAYLSVQSNRMNEVMKRLTLISTVMLPLTFIAGVYGMNFQVMPELGWKWGYAFALGLMAAVAIGVLAWFRTKRWM